MKQFMSVMNSDSINRYGHRFSVGALASALQDEYMLGVPLMVAHDASRLIGWTRPLALYIEPGLARVANLVEMAEDDEEHRQLVNYFAYFLHQRHIEANAPEITHLKAMLNNHLSDESKPIETECVAVVEEGLASRVFPELFSQQDKDGLVLANLLNPIGPGVFQIGELVVFAHQFFRRNLFRLNTLNYPFLEQIQSLAGTGASVRIALDPDMVGLASTYKGERLELAYWWGPKFDDDLTSIPPGVTHHEASEIDRICYGVSATQFRWSVGGEQRVFEAEELRDVPSVESADRYGCRYVHSIASNTGEINHFDGSIRMYSGEDMLNRLEVNLNRAGRHTEYTKLWRIDGVIDIRTWKRLLSDHFRDNYLVGEYLGAKDPYLDEMWATHDTATRSLSEEYAPYSMTTGMGVRIALSYHPRSVGNNDERVVVSFDRISPDMTKTYSYVESGALELKKALIKLGGNLHISNDIQQVSFRDFYVNLPLVFHSSSILPDGVHRTIDAIKMLVLAWKKRSHNWVIGYNLAFPVGDDREARISVLGHVDDLDEWLSTPMAYPPTTMQDLRDWSERTAQHLTDNCAAAVDVPPIFEVLMPTGILLINRKQVEWGNLDVQYSDELQGYVFQLPIPQGEESLSEALYAEGIAPGFGILILDSRCTSCGEPYRDCGCSKLLDANVAQEITEAVPFPFWTDRPL